jgi:hypothetical protein
MAKSIAWSAILGVAFILGMWAIGSAYKYKFKSEQKISVTGLAEMSFESDQIVWNATIQRKNYDLKTAYEQLKQDENSVKNYINQKGIPANEVVFGPVQINKEYNTRYDANGNYAGNEFNGYLLSQTITIDSKDLDKIEQLARTITELIQNGIEINSQAPQYYYSKLSELKVDLLAKASEDAQLRAQSIAENSKGKLGQLLKAQMGIFQITGKNLNEDYSYGGTFNTSSRHKTASITVREEFAVK